jgi:hypothetical protein
VPIDIHTNKLCDWLISRRHCSREWQTQILAIREKINNAIQDMPAHEGITKLLSGFCKFTVIYLVLSDILIVVNELMGFGILLQI